MFITAIQDMSNCDDVYLHQVARFNSWCKDNYLDLNVVKTKEIVIDFRKNPLPVTDLEIDGVKVERVNEFKYLGVIVDDKLNFKSNTSYVQKKCQSRIFCLQKLRNIGISRDILQNFYRSCIQSVLTVSFICWFGSLCVHEKNVLNGVVKVCSKVVGVSQPSLSELYDKRVVKKGRQIANDCTHVLASAYELLPSGKRFRAFNVKTRASKSFVPTSLRLLNSTK